MIAAHTVPDIIVFAFQAFFGDLTSFEVVVIKVFLNAFHFRAVIRAAAWAIALPAAQKGESAASQGRSHGIHPRADAICSASGGA